VLTIPNSYRILHTLSEYICDLIIIINGERITNNNHLKLTFRIYSAVAKNLMNQAFQKINEYVGAWLHFRSSSERIKVDLVIPEFYA